MNNFQEVSIVVPTLNEQDNIKLLVKRADTAMNKANIKYELIFIDDHSTDNTRRIINSLIDQYPIQLHLKRKQPGKAQSILEGIAMSHYSLVGMIDADLQYPPEAIAAMITKINAGCDVVVANRIENNIGIVRRVVSKSFSFLFGRLLHGFRCDIQSGLKVFKREIIERMSLDPSPWTFDLEFLLKARYAGYQIDSVWIMFAPRRWGKSKVGLIRTSLEIGWNAIKLRLKNQEIIPFHPDTMKRKGVGFHYKGQEFIDYTQLFYQESAFNGLSGQQKLFLIFCFLWLVFGLILDFRQTLIVLIGIMTFIYVADLLFNILLIYRSFTHNPEIKISHKALSDAGRREWPIYTVFCPLYKEWQVIPQFIKAMKALDYPKNKLQIILLLESDDAQTLEKVREFTLPANFEAVVIPNSQPKTKPKALNYGLLHAQGDYVAIYDAEDIPEPKQLKKAVLAFEQADPDMVCIQAKLNFYNPRQNVLTRLFTAEYSLWFDMVLTGLQSLNAPIPLGGTSNHFRTEDLYKLQGWDPFNVTEDCDLGTRLSKYGYKTAIIDSTTFEEANSSFKNWVPQRTRWNKGYLQTFLVHTRDFEEMLVNWNKSKLGIFILVVGGKFLSMIINPFMWLITILYFSFRSALGATIESLFPPVIFYLAVFSFTAGNFLYFYYYMIGLAKRKMYDLIKYAYLVPIYWLAMSFAAYRATVEIIVNPHYWAKTIHGLHLNKYTKIEKLNEVQGIIPDRQSPKYPVNIQSLPQ